MPNAMMPLPYLLFLLATPWLARGQECTLGQPPDMALVRLDVAATSVALPAAWKVQVQEFAQGVHVVDATSGCRLETTQFLAMPVPEVVLLHERLYWGTNLLSEGCRASLAKDFEPSPAPETSHLGSYEPRMFGYKHLVWVRGRPGQGAQMILLRCPRSKQNWLTWTVFVAVARSMDNTKSSTSSY